MYNLRVVITHVLSFHVLSLQSWMPRVLLRFVREGMQFVYEIKSLCIKILKSRNH